MVGHAHGSNLEAAAREGCETNWTCGREVVSVAYPKQPMTRARYLVALFLPLSLLAACGDDDGTETTRTTAAATTGPATSAATTTAPEVGESGGEWAGLLASIPDAADTATSVIINDYAAARQLVGVAAPSYEAPEDEVIEYLLALQMGPVADDSTYPVTRFPRMGIADSSFGTREAIEVEAWRTAFGVSVLDVDRTVVAGEPPAELTLWQGAITPETVEAAVTSDPEWSGDLRTVGHGDESYYAWGEDPPASDVERIGPARHLGRGGCLYVTDALALRAVACEVIEAALDARAGELASLADLGPLASLADALQEAGAYAGFLTMDVGLFTFAENPILSRSPQPQPGLLPYLAAATGVALEGDTLVTVVALVHSNDADAAENAVRLERVVAEGSSVAEGRPWSDILSVRDIATDGPLLVARLDTNAGGTFWLNFVFRRDTLLAWE